MRYRGISLQEKSTIGGEAGTVPEFVLKGEVEREPTEEEVQERIEKGIRPAEAHGLPVTVNFKATDHSREKALEKVREQIDRYREKHPQAS